MNIAVRGHSGGSSVQRVGARAGRPNHRVAEADTPTKTLVNMSMPQFAARPNVAGRLSTVAILRAVFVLGVAATAAVAWLITSGSSQSAEPELALLLRGMAALKGLLSVAAGGLVWWRLGQPVASRVAAAYIACVSALCASSLLIWNLSFIPVAALLFMSWVRLRSWLLCVRATSLRGAHKARMLVFVVSPVAELEASPQSDAISF